jgi:hypothetical protein
LNYRTTRENRPPTRTLPLAGKLVLCFALLCAVLLTISGVFFFSLRSLENPHDAERSADRAIAIHYRLGKNVELPQDIFRKDGWSWGCS